MGKWSNYLRKWWDGIDQNKNYLEDKIFTMFFLQSDIRARMEGMQYNDKVRRKSLIEPLSMNSGHQLIRCPEFSCY